MKYPEWKTLTGKAEKVDWDFKAEINLGDK
jgi:hypothetical protein